jgi:hypothetical protein
VAKRFWFFFWTALIAVVTVAAVYLFMGVSHLRETANRMTCAGKLKQLGLALLSFQEYYGCLPPACIPDEHGKPMHSWRVLILEFMGWELLYQKYDFSEPWNGPHNAQLAEEFHQRYGTWLQCRSEDQAEPMWTSYVAVVGRGTLWSGQSPGRVTHAAAGKILVLEVANSGIHWMEPRDLTLEQALAVAPHAGLTPSSRHPAGIQFVTAEDKVGIWSSESHAQPLSEMLVVDTGEAMLVPHGEDPDKIVRQFLHCEVSRVPFFRLRADQMLAKFRQEPKRFVHHFIEATNDERPEIRTAAVEALHKLDPDRPKKARKE